jgi:hypothetical protein
MIVDLEDNLVKLRSEIFRDVSDCKLGVQYSVDEQKRINQLMEEQRNKTIYVETVLEKRENQINVL